MYTAAQSQRLGFLILQKSAVLSSLNIAVIVVSDCNEF